MLHVEFQGGNSGSLLRSFRIIPLFTAF